MKTKKIYAPILILAIIATTGLYLLSMANTNDKKPTGNGFAVVELFTSEGCSSCPSADALVATLPGTYHENVIILGFHVDYWNRLGWKDSFSDAAYSSRQKQYAQTFNLNSIYTPQVVINGKTEMVGSDAKHVHATIEKELNATIKKEMNINASVDKNVVTVNYEVNESNALLNIALVQRQASTNVQRGENEGRVLQHTNVVRDFKIIPADKISNGNITLALPKGLLANDCRVIAYTQNTKDLHILNALEIKLND